MNQQKLKSYINDKATLIPLPGDGFIQLKNSFQQKQYCPQKQLIQTPTSKSFILKFLQSNQIVDRNFHPICITMFITENHLSFNNKKIQEKEQLINKILYFERCRILTKGCIKRLYKIYSIYL